jgi:predicted HTH domain antitoxin
MTITLTLPDTYLLYAQRMDIAREIRLHHAQMLYLQQRISLGKAAELADCDIQEFMRQCALAHLPTISFTLVRYAETVI